MGSLRFPGEWSSRSRRPTQDSSPGQTRCEIPARYRCYGRPSGAAPDNLQPTPRTPSLDEIDALVAYLQARVVGHGKVTREECLFYYEDKADCDDFK
jgi:hypothetical protein